MDPDATDNAVTFSVSDTTNFDVSGTALSMTAATRVYGTNYSDVTPTATSAPPATKTSTSTFSVTVRDSTDHTPRRSR